MASLENGQVVLFAVVSLMFVLSAIAIALRIYARKLAGAKLWWDDWFAILAVIMSWSTNIFIYIAIIAGLGKPIATLTPEQIQLFGLTFFLQELSWTAAMFFVISSILAFDLRLFVPDLVKSSLRITIYAIGTLNLLWAVSSSLTLILQCRPTAFIWDKSLTGTCINQTAFFLANGVVSTATLFFVLLLPIPVLWNLHISRSKRVGLMFSFTIGLFVCSVSIIRLTEVHTMNVLDPTLTFVGAGQWSCVESNIGVASACIPSLMPLLRCLGRWSRGESEFESRNPRSNNEIHVMTRTSKSYTKRLTNCHPGMSQFGSDSLEGLAGVQSVDAKLNEYIVSASAGV